MADYREIPSAREILQSSLLLDKLTSDEITQLVIDSQVSYAAKGEVIWLKGQPVGFFGIVGSGFIKMVSAGPAHQEITTEIMGAGQVFGLLGTVRGTGCPQTAKAVTNTHYLRVRNSEFLPIFQSNTLLKDQVYNRTFQRLHQSFDLIAHLSVGTVEQRVAAVLLVLSRSFGQTSGDGILLDVPLTRQDISELAGTTVESTIRVMSKWQKSGLIETNSKHILLLDLDVLLNTVRNSKSSF